MKNIKIFWGMDHKVGTTMLAQSYAEILAKKGSSVLLLTLSENGGDDYFEASTASIDDLRSRLACNLLTPDILKEQAVKAAGIYKINGHTNPQNPYGYTVEMGQNLIKSAVSAFDNVIIDCGTGLHSPLGIAALKYDGDNVFVMSQQESCMRSWDNLNKQMTGLSIVPQIVVVNKFIKGDHYNINYVAQRTGIPQSFIKTVVESEFGIQAEYERNTILYFGEKQFEKDVSGLS